MPALFMALITLIPLLLATFSNITWRTEHTKSGQAFSKLMAQHNENEMVLKELKLLNDECKVYKLTGPVLLSQVTFMFVRDISRVATSEGLTLDE